MRKRIDMTGQRFDRLTVICFDHRDSGDSLWRCRCDCGNEVVVRRKNLLSGLTKSCGCLKREIGVEKAKKMREVREKKQTEDLTGKVFGKLTVIQPERISSYLCRCECGNEITVYGRELRSGRKTSCGCDRRTEKNIAEDFSRKHGCNVCADKKYCNRTICKYENEFARRKKNEMEAKEE